MTLPTGQELIEFPKGPPLIYCDDDHSYWRVNDKGARGRRLTGVSTVVAPLDFRPDNLMRWVSKLTLQGVAAAFAGQKVPTDPETLRIRLQEMELDWESIRDAAGARGTNVHVQMAHALALGESIPDLGSLPEDQRGYGQAVFRWWADNEPEVIAAERMVYCEQHGFAGQMDLRCRVKTRQGEGIIDWKTSRYISNKMHAQVCGYDIGELECGNAEEHADWLLIVQLNEDGTYTEIPVSATHEDFFLALNTYRAAAQITSAANRARKQREAVAA